MKRLSEKVQEAVADIKKKTKLKPQIAIILGTGLGKLVKEIKIQDELPYEDIPHFAKTTVKGHAGNLIFGKIANKNIVVMEGRFHYYEGYSLEDVTFPVRVMKALGAEILIVSNAAGGMNPQHRLGDLLLIEDHINFMGVNPLIGPNDDKLGPRFPDMCEPYDKKLLELAENTALEEGIRAHKGVYIGVTGPCLETRAEYRMMRNCGADVVGMSTVPEVIVAVHSGLRVLGLSIVTDLCLPDALKPANIEEIIKTANGAEPKLTRLVKRVIEKL